MPLCHCPFIYSEDTVSLPSFDLPPCKIQHNNYQCNHNETMAWLCSTWISASKEAEHYYF